MGAVDISAARILELGSTSYFKSEYPERTTLLWTGARLPRQRALIDDFATPLRVMRALREARDGRYDVIVAYPHRYPFWHPRHWAKALPHTPAHPIAALTRQCGVDMLRLSALSVPLVAIDMDDAFGISANAVFLLDKARWFFKRELPVDAWHALYGTAHRHLPGMRVRNNATWQRRVAKLRPISLPQFGFPDALAVAPFPEKTHDIFFVGTVSGNSSVRSAGHSELDQLAAQGYRIDRPTERLDYPAFLARMARSWLAWSPEGLGWDCNRHYEAAFAQSVPLMNHPTVLRHAPLIEGEHGLYYDPEPGGLARAAIAALADKARLTRIASAARAHVLAHHTQKAYCDYILRCALMD